MSPLAHFVKWKLGRANPETQTTIAERDCLAEHAAGRRCLAEVGVWHGVTTCRLRQSMAQDGILYAIDPYPIGRLGVSLQREIARSEVSRVRNGEVAWVRETGARAARKLSSQLAGRIEFLFIDGDHSYEGILADWEAWSGLILPTGIVALHDSRSSETRNIDDSGTVKYTREVIVTDPRYEVVALVDSLTVLRKRST